MGKSSTLLDEDIAFDGNNRLVKDLLQSSVVDDNQKRVIKEKLQANKITNKIKSRNELILSIIYVSPLPLLKEVIKQPKVSLLVKLEGYESPSSEGRHKIYQLFTLLKVGPESPIYGTSVSDCSVQLSNKGKCDISRSTRYDHVKNYVEYKIMPPTGDGGAKYQSPPFF